MNIYKVAKMILNSSIALGVLFGCSIKEAPPLNLYTFPSPAIEPVQWVPMQHAVLIVSYPLALKEPLTYKMAYIDDDNSEYGYYQNSQWSNNVGKMLQGYLIQTLTQTHLFKAVLPDKSSVPEDQRLESTVYDFTHHIKKDSSYAKVSIEFGLIDMHSGKLIKRKRFTYEVPTPTVDAKGYMAATHSALQKLSRDLAQWLAASTK